MPFVSFILFSTTFALTHYLVKPTSTGVTNSQILSIFTMWTPLVGAVLSFLSMIGMYLVRLVGLKKVKFCGPMLLVLGYAPWMIFGYQLVYREPRFTPIAIAIIEFLGKPILYAGAALTTIGLLWFFISLIRTIKRVHHLGMILTLPFVATLFSGCLGSLIELSCLLSDDPDHCYQAAAVQNSDPYGCEKVLGKGFEGSNPPRDKCYLEIAENTGDYSACDFIKGGVMSYTKQECIATAAIAHNDPAGCRKLTGPDFENCKQSVGASITTNKLASLSEEVENAKSALGADSKNPDLKKKLAELEAKQKDLFDFAPKSIQSEYFTKERETIMSDVDDEDVKSTISQQYIAYRNAHPNESIPNLLKKLDDIKTQQEYVKNLDDQVNEVFDGMKDTVIDFTKENLDEATGASEFTEEMQKKGVEWFKENGGDRVKNGIEHLEWMKGKYDKASEQYEKISAQIDKLKKVYDEANEVYKKIDSVNKLVAEGKIDAGKARVLHGAILLGKGLEYTTQYVPVFGSTISKISKETFEATTKFATERAKRTTAIDKCIDDPEHCDTDGISAY